MSTTVPVQAFQIGQRVRRIAGEYFTIGVIYIEDDLTIRYARARGILGSAAKNLTLAPERPLYVPSERRVIGRDNAPSAGLSFLNTILRCETDAERAARHAAERDAYDRMRADDAVIYNDSGEPVSITGS